MNIDGLAVAIRSVSREEPAQHLADLLIAWKRDETTADELKSHIERAIGAGAVLPSGRHSHAWNNRNRPSVPDAGSYSYATKD